MNYFDYFLKYTLRLRRPRLMQFSWRTISCAGLLGFITAGLTWKFIPCSNPNCVTPIYFGVIVFVAVLFFRWVITYTIRLVRYKVVRWASGLIVLGVCCIIITIWKNVFLLIYLGPFLLIVGEFLSIFGILKKIGIWRNRVVFYLANDRMWIFPKQQPWTMVLALDWPNQEQFQSFLAGTLQARCAAIIYTGRAGEWASQQAKTTAIELQQTYISHFDLAIEQALALNGSNTILIADLAGGAYLRPLRDFGKSRSL